MKWKYNGCEWIARTYINTADGPRAVEWRAYKPSNDIWQLGLSIGESGGHLVVTSAATLGEIKGMAAGAAGQLYHQLEEPL